MRFGMRTKPEVTDVICERHRAVISAQKGRGFAQILFFDNVAEPSLFADKAENLQTKNPYMAKTPVYTVNIFPMCATPPSPTKIF